MVNPLGYVQLSDFGNPRVITGYAREVISGGCFVGMSGLTTTQVSSGADSFAQTDLQMALSTSGLNFIGIAMQKAESGAPVSVAIDGLHICKAVGSVFAGKMITSKDNDVIALGSQVVSANEWDALQAGRVIGRSLTEASSGGMVVALIK